MPVFVLRRRGNPGPPWRPARVYPDTSAIGGCADLEFAEASKALLRLFQLSVARMVLSDLTLLEIRLAPMEVTRYLDTVPASAREIVELSEEASVLADSYLRAGVLAPTKLVDAQHIAIATIARVDALASWNFKHMVNRERIRGYNRVNERLGYLPLRIRSPREIAEHGL